MYYLLILIMCLSKYLLIFCPALCKCIRYVTAIFLYVKSKLFFPTTNLFTMCTHLPQQIFLKVPSGHDSKTLQLKNKEMKSKSSQGGLSDVVKELKIYHLLKLSASKSPWSCRGSEVELSHWSVTYY